MNWGSQRILVTGGASFIGSHLVEELVRLGVTKLRVVDNLSSGKIENIQQLYHSGKIEFIKGDLLTPRILDGGFEDINIVFHLAADHGGRGYVDLHQGACASNLTLDGIIFRKCLEMRVDKIVYASSGCVYPNNIQNNPNEILYLTEDMVGPPYDADNMYGWAKLMGELTLRAYYKDYGLKSACCRYFTVYGNRGHENHAVMAMIAKGFIKQDPFEIWGNGQQIRNWTHVSDIITGTIMAAESIDDGIAVNLGTMERTRVIEAAQIVIETLGYKPTFKFMPSMPTGPVNRVADNNLARKLLGWQPQVKFHDGLIETIKWYINTHDPHIVKSILSRKLTERS